MKRYIVPLTLSPTLTFTHPSPPLSYSHTSFPLSLTHPPNNQQQQNRDMVVDKEFDTAVSLGHEVLLNCGLEDKPGEYGFLVVPIAYERELRARLGLAYD